MASETESQNVTLLFTEQRERTEFAKTKLTFWPAEIRSVDTESNIRGRVKGMFKKYCEHRPQGYCNADLLGKILYQLWKYGMVVPGFVTKPMTCFEDLQKAVAALPQAKESAYFKVEKRATRDSFDELDRMNDLPRAHALKGDEL
jgi:hypothetical protein